MVFYQSLAVISPVLNKVILHIIPPRTHHCFVKQTKDNNNKKNKTTKICCCFFLNQQIDFILKYVRHCKMSLFHYFSHFVSLLSLSCVFFPCCYFCCQKSKQFPHSTLCFCFHWSFTYLIL